MGAWLVASEEKALPQEVLELLEEPQRELTLDELRAQRISFVMGTMGSSNTLTRKQVEDLDAKAYG